MSRVELPHVDVMCLTACNLKCVGCTNMMGAIPMEVWHPDDVMRDVHNAARVMHAHVACLLGGEPTAHPHLLELMRGVAASGLADRVQVLTNGMRLHRMTDEFWAELDWLKVSIYPGQTQPENVALAQDMQRRHGFQLDFYDVAADPFRAVLTDRPHEGDGAQRTYDGCWYRTFTRKIERGFFYRCCTSPQISQTILGLDPAADGVALEDLTVDGLREFLGRREHMASCTRCYGNTGPRLGEWSEQRDKQRWLAESAVPLPMARG